VDNLMPVTLQVNRLVLANLRERWQLPDSVVQNANVVVDETGRHVRNATPAPTEAAAKNSSAGAAAGTK
jgi:hypothetical protein